jgi:transcriptional regulator with XRE-family HTH domain
MPRRGKEPAEDAPFPRLGLALRAARDELDLTQQELAEHTGIPQTQISAFELGKKLPSPGRQARLRRVFNWPEGRIVRLAGLAEEPSTLAEFVDGDPRLSPAHKELLLTVYRWAIEQNSSRSDQ